MVGRFIGSAALQKIAPSKAIAFNAFAVIALLLITIFTEGDVALYAVLSIGLFNSILFPTIFSVAIQGLGSLTSKGSGWLCLAIVGGALIPLIQGIVADAMNIQVSFIIPALCYCFIAWYGLNVVKLASKWQQKIN